MYGPVFIAQLVEHCCANTEAMGLNPVKVQGPVARSLVSANHASSNPGQEVNLRL